jgi:hypothetical protein
MDGGDKQTEMARSIMAQVKQGASARKESNFTVKVFAAATNQHGSHISASNSTTSEPPPFVETAATTPADGLLIDYPTEDDKSDFFISLYLDTVFPLLFPWYQPPALSGGRSWLLVVLKSNKAIFHAAMSLSTYYFTLLIAKDASHTVRTPCEQYVWDRLARHTESSMQVIRHDMDDLNKRQSKSDVFRQIHALQGIVQLLILETTMASSADWGLHLSAAVTILADIFREHAIQDGMWHLPSIILALHRPSMLDNVKIGVPIWNADQAAFRFFTAMLIYADILSSASLRSPPRLYHSYRSLIENKGGPNAESINDTQQLLQMKNYTGCQGWVLLVIGEISALDAWNRSEHRQYDDCREEELDRRSKRLEEQLQQGLEDMREPASCLGNASPADKHAVVAMIWLHAARIYLSVVEHGWQPTNDLIRNDVECVLTLLGRLIPEISLRSLIWPLCVAGFLATPDQDHAFRGLLSALGPLDAFGAAKVALGLLERVWGLRYQLQRDAWGIAECFEAGGNKVLLI